MRALASALALYRLLVHHGGGRGGHIPGRLHARGGEPAGPHAPSSTRHVADLFGRRQRERRTYLAGTGSGMLAPLDPARLALALQRRHPSRFVVDHRCPTNSGTGSVAEGPKRLEDRQEQGRIARGTTERSPLGAAGGSRPVPGGVRGRRTLGHRRVQQRSDAVVHRAGLRQTHEARGPGRIGPRIRRPSDRRAADDLEKAKEQVKPKDLLGTDAKDDDAKAMYEAAVVLASAEKPCRPKPC